MKNIYLFTVALLFIGQLPDINAQTLTSHNFNNGALGPFHECTTKSPNYAKVVSSRLKTYWQESSYNGDRDTKGAEICGANWHTRKEGWMGFTMNLGPDYPTNKTASIAQIFQFYSSTFWSWAALINIMNGDLQITHRSNGGTNGNTNAVVYPNFPKNVDTDIVIHFKLSASNRGLIQIWVNGTSRYYANNINFGYAEGWSNDVQSSQYSYVDLKIGQYNYDNANYSNNETRTVYYDNVSWYTGANGYSVVDPSGGSSSGSSFKLVKRNASGFAMDGGSGGADGQSIELYTNVNHHNLTWVEINRGGGYYSYQKLNTNYCIDGGNGGANGQDVYLWSCDDDNQNQHWLKIDAGNGHYRLQKRNAPGYSIDGGNGGGINQNVYLWASKENEQNQQWRFDNISNARTSQEGTNETTGGSVGRRLVAYPNPVGHALTIDNTEGKYNQYTVFDINGKIQLKGNISNDIATLEVDTNELPSGLYMLKLDGLHSTQTVKLTKD